jgi:hypothetical protein
VTLKACTVVVRDLKETSHSIEVTAETLFEAVAQALAALGADSWVGEIGRGLTTVTVTVRNPEVTHTVKVQDFESWLNRGVHSPAEMVVKSRVRHLLGLDHLDAQRQDQGSRDRLSRDRQSRDQRSRG